MCVFLIYPACRRWLSKHICVLGIFFHLLFTHCLFFFLFIFSQQCNHCDNKGSWIPCSWWKGSTRHVKLCFLCVFFISFFCGVFLFFHLSVGKGKWKTWLKISNKWKQLQRAESHRSTHDSNHHWSPLLFLSMVNNSSKETKGKQICK